jgi:Cft2 family RNA processing exonuclease
MTNEFQLQALGGAMEIGANCLVLSDGTRSLAIDAGLHPKASGQDALPRFDELALPRPSSLVLTHCHHDHIGALPLAMKKWSVRTLTSEANRILGLRMLKNSANVMRRRAEAEMPPSRPLYTRSDVDEIARRIVDIELNRPCTLTGGIPRGDAPVALRLLPAGHVLGACGVDIRWGDERIFVTGDTITHNQNLTFAAELPRRCDTLIMEATLGASPELDSLDREDESERFGRACARTIARGGSVVVPCFALGRTQEMLFLVHALKEEGIIPASVPVYVGGLGRAVSELYDALRFLYPRRHPDLLLADIDAEVIPRDIFEAKDPLQTPSIYLATSGMVQANTPSFRLVQSALSDSRHSILFVGYCDGDADGYPIYRASQGDVTTWRGSTGPVHVECEIDHFRFTAHATRMGLIKTAKALNPKRIFLHHGSPAAIDALTRDLTLELPNARIEALWPHRIARWS